MRIIGETKFAAKYLIMCCGALTIIIAIWFYNGTDKIAAGDSYRKTGFSLGDEEGSLKFPSTTFEKVLHERKSTMHEVCKGLDIEKDITAILKDKKRIEGIIVDDNSKTLYCHIQKVASTSWFKVYMMLTKIATKETIGKMAFVHTRYNITRNNSVMLWQEDNEETLLWKLKTYTKMVAVRDPIQRLISSYRSLVTGRSDHRRRQGREVIEAKNITKSKWQKFVHRVISDTKGVMRNNHFGFFYKRCFPCAIDYDFILHHENIVDEANYFLRYINAPETITFPDTSRYKMWTDDKVLEGYMKGIDQDEINGLYEVFDKDYRLFSYKKIYQN